MEPRIVRARAGVLTGPLTPGGRMAQDVALVTGASSGIGEALARRIARDGRHLALVARRAERLQSLAGALRDGRRIDVHVVPMDLTQPGAGATLAAELERRGLVVDWLGDNPRVRTP